LYCLFSIRFAVVSEPIDKDADCEDIGFAFVNINEIVKVDTNYINKEIKCIHISNLINT
jgi:hypothetical protein